MIKIKFFSQKTFSNKFLKLSHFDISLFFFSSEYMFKLQCSINSHFVFDSSILSVLSLVIINLVAFVIILSSTRFVGEKPTKSE
jgi:hypothetical protein